MTNYFTKLFHVVMISTQLGCVAANFDHPFDGASGLLTNQFLGQLAIITPTASDQATFQIQGTLKDSLGNPIANATLSLYVSQNILSRETVTTSTKTDSSGNYTLNLRIGTFSVKVTNSSGTDIGTFQLKATSTTGKPEVAVTSGSISVVVSTVTTTGTTTTGATITRDWAVFTDMLDGTVKLDVKAGTFGGQTYSATTLYYAKCSHGMTYNLASNTCSGTAVTVQFCSTNDNSCNGGVSTNPVSNGPLFNACNGVSLGGRTSWRVPTKDELRLIINCNTITELPSDQSFCLSGSSSSSINSLFPNTQPGLYWSLSTVTQRTDNAWFVAFGNGRVHYGDKTSDLYVRCVTGL
jgi:hypothetical protein